ncbi:hypothetical protein AX15_006447 [Amanita polypyramis BW_CC]|nr:hypothetical protein AX15_006447 [Amanita polypyramis BW_CC]
MTFCSLKSETPATDASKVEVTVETAIEHAKRAFALRKYEQAVEHYATALELITREHGESAPETADLYLSYGKALLENAISQNSVLGKEQPETEVDEEPAGTDARGAILSFSGDAEDEDEEPAVDLFAQANKEIEEAEREDEEAEAEPEDDFNAAWEVLEMARALYEKQKEEDDEIKLKLADTYIALGDVSLETEKFDQAITDYSEGLKLKENLLPVSSRHIAEAHYKLSMVLDLTSGRLSDAIVHAEKALESVESRIAMLRDELSGQIPIPPPEEQKQDYKGKGKATPKLARDDLRDYSKSQMESELKELMGLKDDLALKVEELKSSPNENLGFSAPELAARALDKELNTSASSPPVIPAAVKDLTSMVKKKKKNSPAEDSGSGKRKAEGDADASPKEKKVRLDTPES